MSEAGWHLVQILIPLRDPEGAPFPRELLDTVRAELTERFGGVTAFLQSPAHGAWRDGSRVERDEVVLVEVMVERPEREWWEEYRGRLEGRFRQEEMVIRSTRIERF